MPAKIFNGGAFVDPSQIVVSDGATFHAPQGVYEWDGSQFVNRLSAPNPQFVQAVSDARSNGAPTVTITKLAGTRLFVGTTTNSGSPTVSMNGGALTPYGEVTSTRLQQLFVVSGAPAGQHTFVMDGGGSWETMIVAEYTGVQTVGAYTSKSSSSQVQTHTPTGSGKLAIALVASASVGAEASGGNPANYVGTLRHRRPGNGSNNQSIAFVDHTAAPLGLNASGVASSVGCMWLS
ncbi:hypothetical protein SEA_LOZINAK_60 [Gordonia phage Lozinak]|uniref:Minor tail protein n=2 Tax=Smoothievirus smoothie TaxID=1982561 RepID=A0A2D1GFX7_9CAUD|nr:minor tail protein [Gordonia phage Smoothie]ANA86217.1 hypothetical protein PBI_SMOOTHIE_61 [Gordonia phage Smoothie]ATN90686.1 hypothetical protein SEA_LOZINAK_60 [Gordonia phage Lozinak]